MTQALLKTKILNLEAELKTLKQAIEKEPNYEIDKINWQKIQPMLKKTREELYRKRYGKR